MSKLGNKTGKPRPNLYRHVAACPICKSMHINEINRLYIAWYPSKAITALIPDIIDKGKGGYTNTESFRHGLNVHVHALGLDAKRRNNVRGSIQRLIENGMDLQDDMTDEERKALMGKAVELGTRIETADNKGNGSSLHVHVDADKLSEEQIDKLIIDQAKSIKADNKADDSDK